MSGFVKGALAMAVLSAAVIALVLHQQRTTERQLAVLATELDELAKQRAPRECPPPSLRAFPPPVDAAEVATRVAALVHRDGDRDQPAARADQSTTTTATAAGASAQALLAAAINRGQLAPEDLRNLRAQMNDASPAERHEVLRQISVALNTGKLVPQDPHNIFP